MMELLGWKKREPGERTFAGPRHERSCFNHITWGGRRKRGNSFQLVKADRGQMRIPSRRIWGRGGSLSRRTGTGIGKIQVSEVPLRIRILKKKD